jgi:DNA transposition AAA+ family ATPase
MTDTEMAIEAGAVDHDALRAAVTELRGAEKATLRSLADEAGIAAGTFSNWYGATYQGDVDRVGRQVRTWLDARPARARVQATMPGSPDFVETATASAILATLEHAQYMPDIALVIGAPGLGKSMTARHYQRRNPNVWLVTAEACGNSVRSMLELIAVPLRIPTTGFSAPKLSFEITKRMRGVSGLVLIDEAQHLSPAALDQARTLHDQAGVGLALVGNESIFARIDGNGRSHFAQLTSRVGMRTVRMRPAAADVGALLDAWKIIDHDCRKTLHSVAQKPGGLRLMDKVLRFSHKMAMGDGGLPTITHIRAAYSRLSSDDELRAVKGVAA